MILTTDPAPTQRRQEMREIEGTITRQDTLVKALEKFVFEVAAAKLPAIFRREITFPEAIHQTWARLPAFDILKLSIR